MDRLSLLKPSTKLATRQTSVVSDLNFDQPSRQQFRKLHNTPLSPFLLLKMQITHARTNAQTFKTRCHMTLKCEREIGQSVPGVDAPRTSLLRLYVGFSSLCNSGLFGVAKMNNPLIIAMMKRPVSFVWLLHIKRDYRLIPHCESRKRFQVYFRSRSVT